MLSNYPAELDVIPSDKTNATVLADDHPDHHNLLAQAIAATQTELGTVPSGAYTTVGARFAAIEGGLVTNVMPIEEFGSVPAGADWTTIFQEAADSAPPGSMIVLGGAQYQLADTVTIGRNNIVFAGGGSYNTIFGSGDPTPLPGTTITWTGAAGGTMFEIRPGNGAQCRLRGSALRGLTIDGCDTAACLLRVRSLCAASFSDLMFTRAATVAVDITTEESILDGVSVNQFVRFVGWAIRVGNDGANLNAIGLRLTSALVSNPSAPQHGNTSNVYSRDLMVRHHSGTAIQLVDAGQCVFNATNIQRYNNIAGTGIGVEFVGSNLASSGHARMNVFFFLEPGLGGVVSRATGYAIPATNNAIYFLSRANLSPHPVVEPGSFLRYDTFADPASYPGGNGLAAGYRLDHAQNARWEEDFGAGSNASGQLGTHGWKIVTTGSGGVQQIVSEAGRYGIVRLSTGATPVSAVTIYLSGAFSGGLIQASGWWDFLASVRLNTPDTQTLVRIGLCWSPTDDQPTDGVFWEKLEADTGWTKVLARNGVRTKSGVAYPADANWAQLALDRIRDYASSVSSFTAWTFNGDIGYGGITNNPTALVVPFVQLSSSVGGKSVDVDWLSLFVHGLTR